MENKISAGLACIMAALLILLGYVVGYDRGENYAIDRITDKLDRLEYQN